MKHNMFITPEYEQLFWKDLMGDVALEMLDLWHKTYPDLWGTHQEVQDFDKAYCGC